VGTFSAGLFHLQSEGTHPMTIAATSDSLSDAQRRALVNHGEGQMWRDQRNPGLLPVWMTDGWPLKRAGLIDWAGPTSSMTVLTPFGQQLRDHLERNG